MNTADAFMLMQGALQRIRRRIEAAQDNDDADLWLELEEIDDICADTLLMTGAQS